MAGEALPRVADATAVLHGQGGHGLPPRRHLLATIITAARRAAGVHRRHHKEPLRALRDPTGRPVCGTGGLQGRYLPVGALPVGTDRCQQEAGLPDAPAEPGVLTEAALSLGGAD